MRVVKYFCDVCGKEIGVEKEGIEETKIEGWWLTVETYDHDYKMRKVTCLECGVLIMQAISKEIDMLRLQKGFGYEESMIGV